MSLYTGNSGLIATGVGRRKTAVAIIQVYKLDSDTQEKQKLIVNDCFGEVFFQFNPFYLNSFRLSLRLLNIEDTYLIKAKTRGGGLSGQAKAISLGLARALCKIDPEYRAVLKVAGLLSRDSRSVERKKYGLKKARKASQYSKR